MIPFALACLCGMGARDQVLLAQMTTAGRRRAALLVIAVATAGTTAALAAWAGADAEALVAPPVRLLARGAALVVAGARLLPPLRPRALREPTHSLAAAAIVLFAVQISDAARLSILALALGGAGAQTASGGALGNAVALAIGWFGGSHILAALPQLGRARRVFGVILIGVAGGLTVAGLFDRN